MFYGPDENISALDFVLGRFTLDHHVHKDYNCIISGLINVDFLNFSYTLKLNPNKV
jgi:hypothetical protein